MLAKLAIFTSAVIISLTSAMAQEKSWADYWIEGIEHSGKGEYFEAIQDYDQAIALNPEYAAAYYNKGIAKRNSGRTQAAKADFQKACQLDSKLCDR